MNRALLLIPVLGFAACSDDKTVEVTPAACIEALDRAEAVFDIAIEGFDLTADGFNAAAEFDLAALERAGIELNALAPEMGEARQQYNTAAASCRG